MLALDSGRASPEPEIALPGPDLGLGGRVLHAARLPCSQNWLSHDCSWQEGWCLVDFTPVCLQDLQPKCLVMTRAIITACKQSLQRLFFYTCLSVILLTGQGVPGQVHTLPQAGTLPWAGSPPGQVHPPGRYTPQAGTLPQAGTHTLVR